MDDQPSLLGWLLMTDAFLKFIPWPSIPPILDGEWQWWGYILLLVIGIPVSMILAFGGFMLFAAFMQNLDFVSKFVPYQVAMRSVKSRSDKRWDKIYRRTQIACAVYYFPWFLALISSIGGQSE